MVGHDVGERLRVRRRGLAGLAGLAGLGVAAAPVLAACSTETIAAGAAPLAFRGAHQGVLTVSAPAGLVGAFDVRVETRDELARLLADLSTTVEGLMGDVPVRERGGGFPAADTGILGPDHGPTGTGVVLGLGASLFDDRFGLSDRRPPGLQPMPRFSNDRLVTPERSNGDLSLTISASSSEAVVHATRQILRATRGRLVPRWVQSGTNQVSPGVRSTPLTGRNLLGFKDGTVNPDPAATASMDEVVWVGAGDGHPEWAVGGTYQAVRVIRMLVEFWDRTRLSEQEAIFHRHRDTGAPLGAADEFDAVDFPDAAALDSHIGRINPRTADSPEHVMLRRGFNYANGLDDNDQLDEGLLFVSYQRDLEIGFLGTQRRLDGEALEEYVAPQGGGLFFVPPGPGAHGSLARGLFD
ncbi:Dyp-type peroxidase [Nocardioides sp.]|uniref:Dyp-type peroxidase n=1 Tax=Nocardioides sp. TaxID=35761 RepID=UPI002B26632A|nr:Dyp-type peroxidase [Nocardioides sp.]